MIETYLANGHDVVLPQMLLDPTEISRFEMCAARADARFVERFLMDDIEHAVARFNARGETEPDDPWHAQVRAIVEALVRCYSALQRLIGQRPRAAVIQSTGGAVDETYRRLIASLD